jgi:hypothetical protein
MFYFQKRLHARGGGLNAPNNESRSGDSLERATISTFLFYVHSEASFARLVDFSIENTTQETCPSDCVSALFTSFSLKASYKVRLEQM